MDKSAREKYQPVIGLEIHAQLLTESKIYTSDSAAYGGAPNTHVGVISLAHPGTLPKLNKRVVEQAVKMGLACHSEISRTQIFDRKNYFYPDLPKGYQRTQDRTPICVGGHVTVSTKDESAIQIKLNRIHIEEDAGKSIHLDGEPDTLIDLNRAGVPLIEIVTEPVIRSSEEAGAMLSEIRKIVRYLQICDGNMEEGSLRCDANISVMRKGATQLGKKVEVKNMNSIRNVQRAIDYEIERQISELEKGNTPLSETRTFDATTGVTSSMRTKEELNDYRYFPDPDLSPLHISADWLDQIKSSMPPLPEELFEKFVHDYNLPVYDARVLTETKEVAEYFMDVCNLTSNYKAASNWIMGPIKSQMNENGKAIVELGLMPSQLSEIIELVDQGKISFANASQQILPAMMAQTDKSAMQLATELNLIQESDQGNLIKVIDSVLDSFPDKVKEYQKGKKGLISMLMGEVMKQSKGKADPKKTNVLLMKKLSEL